jgi:hypothetical protein
LPVCLTMLTLEGSITQTAREAEANSQQPLIGVATSEGNHLIKVDKGGISWLMLAAKQRRAAWPANTPPHVTITVSQPQRPATGGGRQSIPRPSIPQSVRLAPVARGLQWL